MQIRSGKGAVFYLGDGAGFHIAAQKGLQDDADSGLSFAALSGEKQHLLPLGGGDQTVAEELLHCGNVLRMEQLR